MLFETSTSFDVEAFEDGVFDVTVDAARFAFHQTLHSPFEVLSKTGEENPPQKGYHETRAYRASIERNHAVLHRSHKSATSFKKTTSKTYDSEMLPKAGLSETKKIKPRSGLKFLLSCFGGSEVEDEDKPMKRKLKRRFQSADVKQNQSPPWDRECIPHAVLATRGSGNNPDSSAHRYHRRQDFMRSMLESQLEGGVNSS